MFRLYPNEQFKEFSLPIDSVRRYAVSNKGRVISFFETIEDGRLLSGSNTSGYRVLRFTDKVKNKTISRGLFHYKLVAEHFVPRPSEEHEFIIHLDYERDNDDASNLRWVNKQQMLEHKRNSPHVKRAGHRRSEYNKTADGWKLTATKVILIKKLLSKPDRKTRLKMLAKQFGVSETHLKRIERGENWGHIKV